MRWYAPSFNPAQVTTVSPDETPAEQVGMSQQQVDIIWGAVCRLFKQGLHPAIGLCIRRRGQVVIDRAIGHTHGAAPGSDHALQRATPDSLFNLFSGAKCVSGMLVHHLVETGALRIDDPVAEFIPEFARHGKHRITMRHLMSHQAGIPATPPQAIDLDLLGDRSQLMQYLCEMKPESEPGKRVAYHALTAGFLIGEVVERVSGTDLRSLHDRVVRGPLGFKHLSFGVSEELAPLVAREALTGPPPVPPFGGLLNRALGIGLPQVVEMANDRRFQTAVVPSGNLVATPNEVSRFFEMLLRGGELDGVRVFEERTVRRALQPQAARQVDGIIKLPLRYSLGFMLGSQHLSFFGLRSPSAFGHLGFTNVLAWADPQRDISVAFMNNGKPFITPGLLLWLDIMQVIARNVPRDGQAPRSSLRRRRRARETR